MHARADGRFRRRDDRPGRSARSTVCRGCAPASPAVLAASGLLRWPGGASSTRWSRDRSDSRIGRGKASPATLGRAAGQAIGVHAARGRLGHDSLVACVAQCALVEAPSECRHHMWDARHGGWGWQVRHFWRGRHPSRTGHAAAPRWRRRGLAVRDGTRCPPSGAQAPFSLQFSVANNRLSGSGGFSRCRSAKACAMAMVPMAKAEARYPAVDRAEPSQRGQTIPRLGAHPVVHLPMGRGRLGYMWHVAAPRRRRERGAAHTTQAGLYGCTHSPRHI